MIILMLLRLDVLLNLKLLLSLVLNCVCLCVCASGFTTQIYMLNCCLFYFCVYVGQKSNCENYRCFHKCARKWVACDCCSRWFHCVCVGISPSKASVTNFVCMNCITEWSIINEITGIRINRTVVGTLDCCLQKAVLNGIYHLCGQK